MGRAGPVRLTSRAADAGAICIKAFVEPYAFFRYYVGLGVDTTGFYIDPQTSIGVGGGVRAGAHMG